MNKNVAVGICVAALVVVIVGAFAYGIPAGVFLDGKDSQFAAVVVPFTELARGAESAIGKRVNYLITSQEQLRELWEIIGEEEPIPSVDFSASAVAAVFAGEKPTGGYDIAVSSVTDADVRTVTVTLAEPGGDCVLTQAITAPYQVIAFPNTTRKLVHEDISTTAGCPE